MANTKTKTQKPSEENASHARALARLQDTVDDVCARITDDPTRSLRARALRSRSVSQKVRLAALEALESAVADCRAALEAVDAPTEKVSRVNLLEA